MRISDWSSDVCSSDLEVPIIAAVNGPAMGAGMDFATMCTIRIASEKAKFAESFIKLGLTSAAGGAWFLNRAIGTSAAAEMTLTGDTIDPARARSEEHTSELQSLMRSSYAVLCLTKTKRTKQIYN